MSKSTATFRIARPSLNSISNLIGAEKELLIIEIYKIRYIKFTSSHLTLHLAVLVGSRERGHPGSGFSGQG
jgi:hypothetical protein